MTQHCNTTTNCKIISLSLCLLFGLWGCTAATGVATDSADTEQATDDATAHHDDTTTPEDTSSENDIESTEEVADAEEIVASEEVEEEVEEESEEELSEEEVPEEEIPEEDPPAEEELPPEETPDPILFGFWGWNGYTSDDPEHGLSYVQESFNATIIQVAQSGAHYTATQFLPLLQANGLKATLRLSGGNDTFTTVDGSFDLQAWKDALAVWDDACVADADDCLQSFIDDGTLVGHMLLDDIFTFQYGGTYGTQPTAADLDEMARYSEELFPGLMTFVRNKASTMPVPEGDGQYVYLDACVNQYTNFSGYSDGPIADYVAEQAAAAASLGLDVINGLNIVDGGDGSSGVEGARVGKSAMTAAEITEYGEALMDRETFPSLQIFLMWEYDGDSTPWLDPEFAFGDLYFNQTELQEAIANLGLLAAE